MTQQIKIADLRRDHPEYTWSASDKGFQDWLYSGRAQDGRALYVYGREYPFASNVKWGYVVWYVNDDAGTRPYAEMMPGNARGRYDH